MVRLIRNKTPPAIIVDHANSNGILSGLQYACRNVVTALRILICLVSDKFTVDVDKVCVDNPAHIESHRDAHHRRWDINLTSIPHYSVEIAKPLILPVARYGNRVPVIRNVSRIVPWHRSIHSCVASPVGFDGPSNGIGPAVDVV